MRGNGAVGYKPDNIRHDRFCVKFELQVVQCCQKVRILGVSLLYLMLTRENLLKLVTETHEFVTD